MSEDSLSDEYDDKEDGVVGELGDMGDLRTSSFYSNDWVRHSRACLGLPRLVHY